MCGRCILGYVWANAKYPTPYVGVYLRSGEYSPVADGDSISGEFPVQSGAELTEAAGAKRAALRPNGSKFTIRLLVNKFRHW